MTSSDTTASNKSTSPGALGFIRRFWLPILLGLVIVGGFVAYFGGLNDVLTFQNLGNAREQVSQWITDYAIFIFIAWVILYAAVTASMFPIASLMTIGGGIFAGAAFGTFWGTVYAGTATVLGATLGATVLFVAVKSLGFDGLRKRVAPQLDSLSNADGQNAFLYLLTLRLIPFFPFFLVNIGTAILGFRTLPYFFATLIGIAPATYVYTSLGAGIASVPIGEDFDPSSLVSFSTLGPLIALAVLSVLIIVLKRVLESRSAKKEA